MFLVKELKFALHIFLIRPESWHKPKVLRPSLSELLAVAEASMFYFLNYLRNPRARLNAYGFNLRDVRDVLLGAVE